MARSNKHAAPKSLPYRPGVGVMLFNRMGLVLVAQRIDMKSDAWQMPQGGIDAGEEPRAAVLRELAEEIGTARAEFLAESAEWHYYDLPSGLRTRLWGGRYRGQMQRWFAMRFVGEDRDINLATEHPEFSVWRWATIAELPALAITFKRPLYLRLAREFARFAEPV
jgi:putative (di)nucleoside polyphosphate hydrolase